MRNYIVSDTESLLKLISKDKAEVKGDIKLMIQEIDANENTKYEKLLNKWSNACGCELGAVFCFIAIISFIIFVLVTSESYSWILLRNGFMVCFMAALMGKVIGIVVAKIRLKRTVRLLARKL